MEKFLKKLVHKKDNHVAVRKGWDHGPEALNPGKGPAAKGKSFHHMESYSVNLSNPSDVYNSKFY